MKLNTFLAAAALLTAGAANANLLSNGNFETGNTNGWTRTGNVAATGYLPNGVATGSGSAANGHYMAVFNTGETSATGVLSQTFGTVAGQTYKWEFDFGVTTGGTLALNAVILGSNGTAQLVSQLLSDNTSGPLTHYSYNFIADGAFATVRYSDIGSNFVSSVDSLIDNVAVNAVPEPASLAVMGLGLAGLLVARRRRQG